MLRSATRRAPPVAGTRTRRRAMGRPNVSAELLDLLNRAIARELQVSIQYMWQHVLWSGVQGYAVKDELRSIGITEMKHAEAIAERLNYLGGVPTTKPEPIFVGETLKEMLERDKADEEGALVLYREIVKKAGDEGDVVTKQLFKNILADEEEHHDTFTSLLEGM
jgi:bacterioferritin